MIALDSVTAAVFETALNEEFSLVQPNGLFPVKLSHVRALPGGRPNAKREPFAVVFDTAKPVRVPQGVYRVQNERLGQMEIFLVQVSPTEVEAVFT